MFPVTDEYKDNIYARSRRIYGRVTFDISPLKLQGVAPTMTSSAEFYISNRPQVADKIRDMTYKHVTYETDRTTLDASFTFASDTSANWGQVGYVSDVLCDSDGDFAAPIQLTLTYPGSYTTGGVTVTFDTSTGEYAVNYEVTLRNASNVILYQQIVTGNTDVQYAIIAPVTGFKSIQLRIFKWSHGHRRARIAELEPGVLMVYDNDKLIRMSTTEEIDPLSAQLVVPEFEFTIDNTSKEFDMFNPTGVYLNLEQRQQIRPELGLELPSRIEWVPLGVYLLSEWRADTGSMTATFKGRSRLDLLDTAYYERNVAGINLTMYSIIENLLITSEITSYWIDPSLQLVLTNGIMSRRTCREALQFAAMASRATIRMKDTNVLSIEPTRSNTNVDTITFDEILDEPMIQLEKPTRKVTVFYYDNNGDEIGSYTTINHSVEVGEEVLIDGNTFINTFEHARDVAQWVLARRNERKKITASFRGNPAHEIYDRMRIQNRYVSNLNMHLTRVQMEYDGTLSAQIEGRAL